MSEPAPAFKVETSVEAHIDDVWRALTDPAEIRRWFGWDYDGLEDEIRFIFSDHARQHPPDRIELADQGDGQTIELQAGGIRTLVTITRPGEPAGEDRPDAIAEGWRQFLTQLRFALERHPGEDRRTVRVSGEAVPRDVLAAAEGEVWQESRFQRALTGDGTLVVIVAESPLDSDRPAPTTATITAYGADDSALSRLSERLEAVLGS